MQALRRSNIPPLTPFHFIFIWRVAAPCCATRCTRVCVHALPPALLVPRTDTFALRVHTRRWISCARTHIQRIPPQAHQRPLRSVPRQRRAYQIVCLCTPSSGVYLPFNQISHVFKYQYSASLLPVLFLFGSWICLSPSLSFTQGHSSVCLSLLLLL